MRDNDCRGCGKPIDLEKTVYRASGGGLLCPSCVRLADACEAELRRLETVSMAMDLVEFGREVRK